MEERRAGLSSLERRVGKLEKEMVEVMSTTKSIDEKLDTALDILTAAKSVSGFARKHGPRIIAFGTGVMAAAGIGNPEVWKFIRIFFGG